MCDSAHSESRTSVHCTALAFGPSVRWQTAGLRQVRIALRPARRRAECALAHIAARRRYFSIAFFLRPFVGWRTDRHATCTYAGGPQARAAARTRAVGRNRNAIRIYRRLRLLGTSRNAIRICRSLRRWCRTAHKGSSRSSNAPAPVPTSALIFVPGNFSLTQFTKL